GDAAVTHRGDGRDEGEVVVGLREDVPDGAEKRVAPAARQVDGAAAHAGGHPSGCLDEGTGGAHEDQGESWPGVLLHGEDLDVEPLDAATRPGREPVAREP